MRFPDSDRTFAWPQPRPLHANPAFRRRLPLHARIIKACQDPWNKSLWDKLYLFECSADGASGVKALCRIRRMLEEKGWLTDVTALAIDAMVWHKREMMRAA